MSGIWIGITNIDDKRLPKQDIQRDAKEPEIKTGSGCLGNRGKEDRHVNG